MWLAQLLLVFAVSSVGPGLLIARRWRLSPLEKLGVSVGLSLLLVYVASFAIFAAGLDPRWHSAVSVVCLGLTLLVMKDLARLCNRPGVRRVLLAQLLLFVWGFLLLSLIAGYGGGTWSGDWLEQYQRSQFFLGGLPLDTRFIGQFPLPARPPMMNALTAHFLAQAMPFFLHEGDDYQAFQVVYLLLNALALIPCCLAARNLIRMTPAGVRRLPWMVLLLLAASPMFCQNLTYAWSKLFTVFYVLLALHLYLRGWRKGRLAAARGGGDWRIVLAFASMCAGLLVHYSAGPYGLFMGLHYLTRAWRTRSRRWIEAAWIAFASGAILCTWFIWSVHAYGPKVTFASNSTVTDSAPMSAGENALNIGKNLLDTLVPTILRRPSLIWNDVDLRQPTLAGRVRDFAFLCYQVSVTFGLGSIGVLLVGFLLLRAFFGKPPPTLSAPRPEKWFWAAFIPFVYVVGVVVYGGRDRFGVAHICLQGLVLLGLCLLAAGWRSIPSPWRWAIVPGLALDFAVGVLLQFDLESRYFPFTQVGGRWFPLPFADWQSRAAQFNRTWKYGFGLTFWGDSFAGASAPLVAALIALLLAIAWLALRPAARRVGVARRARRRSQAGPSRRRKARPRHA